jgi:hypothetical protein
MLTLVQPFGLGSWGGGARILSSLVAGSADSCVSICTSPNKPPMPPAHANVVEMHLPCRPSLGRLERTRLHSMLAIVDAASAPLFTNRLVAAFRRHKASTIHLLPHAPDFWPAYTAARKLRLRVIISAHDDIRCNPCFTPLLSLLEIQLGRVWRGADAAMTISEELGQEYNKRFGAREYTVVTDGVERIADAPRQSTDNSFRVYFGGAQHLSYGPNFEQLAAALGIVKAGNADLNVTLTMRGSDTQLRPPGVHVRALPWADHTCFVRDLDDADLLYLPLPFGPKYNSLSRFSLSTKMVTYLASGVPILFHGPANSAAGRLLAVHGAAICVNSLSTNALVDGVKALPKLGVATAKAALRLAADQFRIDGQRQQFWRAAHGTFVQRGSA